MELSEFVSKSIKTARAVGIVIGGALIAIFLAMVAGEFDGTWFDMHDPEPEQTEHADQDVEQSE